MKRAAIVLASAIAVAAIGGCSSTATTTSTTPAATPATASAAPTAGRMGSGGPPSDRGPGNGVGGGMGNGNGPARATSGAVTAAPPAGTVAAAAWEALMSPEGEYAAAASYQAVIAKFGDVEPYVSIEAMEQNHIQALTRQLSRFGFVPPANPYAGTIAAPADLVTAAQAWVDGERKNVALYDRLAAAATGDAGVTRVFTNLRRSSLDAHLPLFEAAEGRRLPHRAADGRVGVRAALTSSGVMSRTLGWRWPVGPVSSSPTRVSSSPTREVRRRRQRR